MQEVFQKVIAVCDAFPEAAECIVDFRFSQIYFLGFQPYNLYFQNLSHLKMLLSFVIINPFEGR